MVNKLCLIFVFPILIGIFGAIYMNNRSEEQILFQDSDGEIIIEHDSNGVPHIYASTLSDAFFGQGYATASDRLWQMDLNRRIPSGTLSELLGPNALEIDIFFRNIKLRRLVTSHVDAYDENSMKMLRSFAAGVNHYVKTHYLPIEYWIVRNGFTPWEPVDSAIIGYLGGLGLNSLWGHDLIHLKLDMLLGKKYNELFGLDSVVSNLISTIKTDELPEELRGESPDPLQPPPLDEYPKFESFYKKEDLAEGSNAWAISGKYTKSGHAILASDPHLTCTIPGFWYHVSVSVKNGPRFDGFGQPGFPPLSSTRTKKVAWAPTSLRIDAVDVFVEKTRNGQALLDGKWYDLQSFNETIHIKGKEPMNLQFWESVHGPLLSKEYLNGAKLISLTYSNKTIGHDIAFKFWAQYNKLNDIGMFMKAIESETVDDVRTAFKECSSVLLACVLADSSGNIAFQSTGRVPKRKTNGDYPLPGWNSSYDWDGVFDYEDNPYVKNPAKGYIVAANNFPTAENYKHFNQIGRYFMNERARRIEDLVSKKIAAKKVTLEDMFEIQMDEYNELAKLTLPNMLDLVSGLEKEVTLLREWDFKMSKRSKAAALYSSWIVHFSREIITDEIEDPEIINTLLNNYYVMLFSSKILNHTDFWHWCDDIITHKKENCNEILQRSLKKASEEVGDLSWGEVHKVHIKHAFNKVPILSWIFDRSAETGGSHVTPNSVGFKSSEGLRAINGPNLRSVIDFEGSGVFILETGQSGNIFSKHYDDMVDEFYDGKYRNWDFDHHDTAFRTTIHH